MTKTNYQRVKEWRAKPENKAKVNAQAQRWRAKHPDIFKKIGDKHRRANAEKIRVSDAANHRRYRADVEGNRRRTAAFKARKEAERVVLAGRPRPDVCELCKEHHLRIVFDHCHQKGHFRGWLCDRCNKVLGLMKDDATLLSRMADYLRGSLNGETVNEGEESSPG